MIKHLLDYSLDTYSPLEIALRNEEAKAPQGSYKIVQVSYCVCILLIILLLLKYIYEITSLHSRCLSQRLTLIPPWTCLLSSSSAQL